MQPTLLDSNTLANLQKGYQSSKSSAHFSSGGGGLLERALPAIGGVVGGIGGEALDVFGGGVLGASAGSAVGQKLQNLITGNKASTAGAGVAGAAGELGGQLVGKGLGKLGAIVTNPIDKGVASVAERKAANEAVEDAAPYANVPKGVRESTNLNATLQRAKDLGMGTDPQSLKTIANLRTGQNGAISGALRQILSNVGPVATDGVMEDANKALVQEAGNLGDSTIKGSGAHGTLREVRDLMQSKLFKGQGSISAGAPADANDVLDTIQALETKTRGLPNTDAGISRGNVFKAVKSSLEDKLYGNGGVDAAVNGFKLAPEDEEAIKLAAQKQGGSPELAQKTIDDINDAKTGRDLRSAQEPDVRADQLAAAADKSTGGALPQPINGGAGGGFGQLSSVYEAGSALHGNPAAAGVLAYKASRAEPVVNAASGIRGIASKLNSAPGGTANDLARLTGQSIAQGVNQSNSQPASSAVPAVPQTPDLSALTSENQQSQAQTPFNSDNIQNAILQDMANNGGKNVSELVSLYNTFGKPSSASDLASGQQTEVEGLRNAVSTLGAYQQQLDSANTVGPGTAQIVGALAGLPGLNHLVGQQGANVRALEQSKTDIATQIAKALTNGKPAASTIKQWENALPSVTDTQQVRQAKMQQLAQRLQPVLQQAFTPLSDESSVDNVLSQLAGQ